MPPLGGNLPQARRGETASTALAAAARAAIEARCVMARTNPRNWDLVRDRILRECRRPSFAEAAEYKVPRGYNQDGSRKFIYGPSIRFVEVALRSMGNIDADQQTIYDDDERRIVRVTVLDIETNTAYRRDISMTKTVERKSLREGQVSLGERRNSYGDRVYLVEASEDELMMREGALVSKAIRTLGERFVPSDLIDEALAICAETCQAKDKENPDDRRRRLLDSFSRQGVSPADLSEYLGHDTSSIQPAEMDDLRTMYRALKDGQAVWADILADALEARERRATAAKTGNENGARGRAATLAKIADLRLQNPGRYAEVCAEFNVPPKSSDWQKSIPEDVLGEFLTALRKEGAQS